LTDPTTFVEQVGGKHYQAEVQHWDIVEQYDIGYLEATATKYLTRWRKRGQAEIDLGKASSYLQKMLACRPHQGSRRLAPVDVVQAFCLANRLHHLDAGIIERILCSGSHEDIAWAFAEVEKLRAQV
jgi:hypothetical protein